MLQYKRVWGVLVAMLVLLAVAPVFAQDAAPVEMWVSFTDSRLDWINQKVADFQTQFPNLPQINVTGYADDNALAAAVAGANSNALPAIVQYAEAETQTALDSGNFKTITDALHGRASINGVQMTLSDFVTRASTYYTISHKLTAVPFDLSSPVLFSNSTMLQAAGVSTPPKTWADMDADCAKIMASPKPPSSCFTWPNHGWFFEEWLAQQNASFANNNNGRGKRATQVSFNGDAGVAILTWLMDVKNKGYLYYSGAQGDTAWATVDQAFTNQQVAMAITDTAAAPAYSSAAQQYGFSLQASNLPYNQATGLTGTAVGGGALWLTTGLDKATEDAALTWIFWLTNSANAADWHKATGYVPVRQSAMKALTSAGWFTDNPAYQVGAQELTSGKSTTATAGAVVGNFPAIRDLITGAIDTALQTPGSDPQTLLNTAADSANKLLNEYNALNAG